MLNIASNILNNFNEVKQNQKSGNPITSAVQWIYSRWIYSDKVQ